jgi:hypothetical protein
MERGLLPEYLCNNLNQVHNMHTHTTLEEGATSHYHSLREPFLKMLFYKTMQLYNNLRRNDEFQNIRTLGKTWQKALLELQFEYDFEYFMKKKDVKTCFDFHF